MTSTLGISAFYHDSAASLIIDGQVVAAAQEERFTRIRHDSSFPFNAIRFVLEFSQLKLEDIDYVSYYEDPYEKADRVAATAAISGWKGMRNYWPVLKSWSDGKIKQEKEIIQLLKDMGDRDFRTVEISRHHESHAASAFFPSPFDSAAILCLDSVGEWATTSIWSGNSQGIRCHAKIDFPNSIGLLYSAFTYFCGFKVDSGEYKLMGLAPYGKPKYKDTILTELIDVKADGSFRLDYTKFEFINGKLMTGEKFEKLFSGPRRSPESDLTEREFDLAASVQSVIEMIVLRLAETARKMTGEQNLCLAGGVALNCVANGKIADEKIFQDIWVQPAAGDAGGSLGAALLTDRSKRSVCERELPSTLDGMQGSLLGPEYPDSQIRDYLISVGAVYEELPPANIDSKAAKYISEGKVIGWFQGRMEFGPRALGGRSILGDPRNENTQSTMNLRIKFRESFRPFAPSILLEEANKYFDLQGESPYMLLVAKVARAIRLDARKDISDLKGIDLLKVPRSTLPAVTHVDFSARVQTVDAERNPRYKSLIDEFFRITGCPALVNTSFNVRGEPIVNTPEDAYRCFMRTNMDGLAIGSFFLDKSDQPRYFESHDWRRDIPLD